MGELEDFLGKKGQEYEPQLKSRLNGLLGGLYKSYLPQAWVVQTEDEVVTLRVGKDGSITVAAGADPTPDVTVEIPKKVLLSAMRSGTKGSAPKGSYKVTTHTSKGKTTFDVMKQQLGL